jgi:hypothetical protein
MRRILFIGLLIALVGGVQAEELINYSEDIGPYTVSFSLPELPSGPVEFERNISHEETLGGVTDDRFELDMRSGGHSLGYVIVEKFGADVEYNLKAIREGRAEFFKSYGYVVNSAEREIDNVIGIILHVEDAPHGYEFFNFYYQEGRQTGVQGGITLPWNQTLPFLKTLNVSAS